MKLGTLVSNLDRREYESRRRPTVTAFRTAALNSSGHLQLQILKHVLRILETMGNTRQSSENEQPVARSPARVRGFEFELDTIRNGFGVCDPFVESPVRVHLPLC